MNWLKKIVVSLGPRIIGAAAAGLSGWLFAKTKGTVSINPDQVVEIAGSMITAYAVAHRAVSAVGVNPGDAASGRMAAAEKDALNTGTTVQPEPPVK